MEAPSGEEDEKSDRGVEVTYDDLATCLEYLPSTREHFLAHGVDGVGYTSDGTGALVRMCEGASTDWDAGGWHWASAPVSEALFDEVQAVWAAMPPTPLYADTPPTVAGDVHIHQDWVYKTRNNDTKARKWLVTASTVSLAAAAERLTAAELNTVLTEQLVLWRTKLAEPEIKTTDKDTRAVCVNWCLTWLYFGRDVVATAEGRCLDVRAPERGGRALFLCPTADFATAGAAAVQRVWDTPYVDMEEVAPPE